MKITANAKVISKVQSASQDMPTITVVED